MTVRLRFPDPLCSLPSIVVFLSPEYMYIQELIPVRKTHRLVDRGPCRSGLDPSFLFPQLIRVSHPHIILHLHSEENPSDTPCDLPWDLSGFPRISEILGEDLHSWFEDPRPCSMSRVEVNLVLAAFDTRNARIFVSLAVLVDQRQIGT